MPTQYIGTDGKSYPTSFAAQQATGDAPVKVIDPEGRDETPGVERRAPDQDAAIEKAFVAGTLPTEDRRTSGTVEQAPAGEAGQAPVAGVSAPQPVPEIQASAPSEQPSAPAQPAPVPPAPDINSQTAPQLGLVLTPEEHARSRSLMDALGQDVSAGAMVFWRELRALLKHL